jgi:hypothetical protein
VLRELPGSLQLQALFSEQGIEELFGATTVLLPEEEIKVGHRWQDSDETTTEWGTFKRTRSYEFADILKQGSREQAHFLLETTLEPVGQSSDEQSGTLLDYTESGDMYFDTSGGYFTSFEIKSTTKTEMPFREKLIQTQLKNSMRMTIEKK